MNDAGAELCDIPLDISRDELERRMAAFGDGRLGVAPTVTLHGHQFRHVGVRQSEAIAYRTAAKRTRGVSQKLHQCFVSAFARRGYRTTKCVAEVLCKNSSTLAPWHEYTTHNERWRTDTVAHLRNRWYCEKSGREWRGYAHE